MVVYRAIKGESVNMTTKKQENMITNVDAITLAATISKIYKCSIEEANEYVRRIIKNTQKEPVYKIVDYVTVYNKVNKKVASL
jgi:hypothetical protein